MRLHEEYFNLIMTHVIFQFDRKSTEVNQTSNLVVFRDCLIFQKIKSSRVSKFTKKRHSVNFTLRRRSMCVV